MLDLRRRSIVNLFRKGSFARPKNVQVHIPKAALQVIFAECDRYDQDETGGRILGTYEERTGRLIITVTGIIEPGPRARRTATSFFQDGLYQEEVFRDIEVNNPSLEHLGNWHTHHVNGYPTLSGGDIETYRRIVEHKNHNTDFFYALLVVARHSERDSLARYAFKNYLLRRGDPRVYEIDRRAIKVMDGSLIWPPGQGNVVQKTAPSQISADMGRVYDRDMLLDFFPNVAPYMSKQLGMYWRGPIGLVDGTHVEVLVMENSSARGHSYTIALRKPPSSLLPVADDLGSRTFPSARVALVEAERTCNRVLYELLHQQ